jgi:exopolyphosphatase / guanosine-5'-triphosphate,3'-diphosphate pyrophosphatase
MQHPMSEASTGTVSRKTNGSPSAPPAGRRPLRSLRVAAIDIGSNSIHMIVAQADADGGVTTLWRIKEMVGLGRMSFPSRRLSRQAIERAVASLGRMKAAARLRQAERIVAVATSAVREAINGGDLIERIQREHGLHVRVVSPREEARLIYLGVRHAVRLHNRPHLIVDIGGGSVEFVVGDERRSLLLESRKLGSARMTAHFVRSDPISQGDRKALLRHYDHELAPLLESIRGLDPVKVIGTSGTLENLAVMCANAAGGKDRDDQDGDGQTMAGVVGVIERKRLGRLLEELLESTAEKRARMSGLDDQRKDQIVAGALLVDRLMNRLHIKRIHVCRSALREGVLLDYLSRHLPDLAILRELPDARRRSIIDLARRCDWHRGHSEQVARLALALFDQLRPLHRLGAPQRELIEYGALLHDIGWHIGRRRHHRHSAYLIAHGELREFTPEEVAVIANIARYHRKALPSKGHRPFAALGRRERKIVQIGAALLRVADGLDRSHGGVVQGLRCRIGRKKLRCTVYARSDAELEIWGARRKMDLFQKVLGRRVQFILAEGG